MHQFRTFIRWAHVLALALAMLFFALAAGPAPTSSPISPTAFATAVTPSAFVHQSLGYTLVAAVTPNHALYPATRLVWEHKPPSGPITGLWIVTYFRMPRVPLPSTWTPSLLSEWVGYPFATQLHTHFSTDLPDQHALSGIMPGIRLWTATTTIQGQYAVAGIEAWHFGTMVTLSELVVTPTKAPIIAGESIFTLSMATYLGEKDWIATHPHALTPS